MIWSFKVKLSLCRGPTEVAVVVGAIEEDLMEAKTKLNQRPGEVTIGEAFKEGEAEDSTIISISIMCRMGSVVVLPTSMLNKTWALSSST
jgi:hypothetical protein